MKAKMRPAVALPVPAIAVVASFSAAVLTTILAAGGGVQALSVPGRFVGAFAPAHSPLCSPPSTRRDPRFVSSVSPLYSSYGGVSPPPPYSDGPEGGIGSEATPSTPEATPFGGDPWIDESVLSAPDSTSSPCVIKVLGVGGGGGNAVNRMIETRVSGVAFWALNTDAQALSKNLAPNILNIGRQLTRGLGAGGDPSVGKAAAMENGNDIEHICQGADMVFITAGMGGGTGSGGAAVVADIAKNTCGCLTVGVVTKPFAFEGKKRTKQALEAIENLRGVVDTLIVVSNDKLLRIVPDRTPVTDAFLVADDILRQGVVGVTEIILKAGMVNLDFADIRTVMRDAGTGIMGLGTGVGRTRATDAALAAISSPLLDLPISSARRVVFNVVGSSTMTLEEINSASEVIHENSHEDANIMFGALIDDGMGDEVSVTVVACDFREDSNEAIGEGDTAATPQSNFSSEVEEGRDPNFYKDRRSTTRSPLGVDATLEETRTAIKRGFKMPEPRDGFGEEEVYGNNDEAEVKRRKGGIRGFFGRLGKRRKQ